MWADQDECQNEVYCINGECLNTVGSYHCFCSLPLVLDATGNRCVNFSGRAGKLWHALDHPTCSRVIPEGAGGTGAGVHGHLCQDNKWLYSE